MLNHLSSQSSYRTRAIVKTPQANLWNSWRKDDIRREVAKRAAMDHLKLLLQMSRLEPKSLKIDALAALMNALVSRNALPVGFDSIHRIPYSP